MADIDSSGAKIPIAIEVTGGDEGAAQVEKVTTTTTQGAQAVVESEKEKRKAIDQTAENEALFGDRYKEIVAEQDAIIASVTKAREEAEQRKRDAIAETESAEERAARQAELRAEADRKAAADAAALYSFTHVPHDLPQAPDPEAIARAAAAQQRLAEFVAKERAERERLADIRAAELALQKQLDAVNSDRILQEAKMVQAEKDAAVASRDHLVAMGAASTAIVATAKEALGALSDVVKRANEVDPQFGAKLKRDYSELLALEHPIDAFFKLIESNTLRQIDLAGQAKQKAKEMHDEFLKALEERKNASMVAFNQEQALLGLVSEGNRGLIELEFEKRKAVLDTASAYRDTAKAMIEARAATDPNFSAADKAKALAALESEAAADKRQAQLDELEKGKQIAAQNLASAEQEKARARQAAQDADDELARLARKRELLEQNAQQEKADALVRNKGVETPLPLDLQSKLDETSDLMKKAKATREAADKKVEAIDQTLQGLALTLDNTAQSADVQAKKINDEAEANKIGTAITAVGDKQKEIVTSLSDLAKNLKAQADATADPGSKAALEKVAADITQSIADGRTTEQEFARILGDIKTGITTAVGESSQVTVVTLNNALAVAQENFELSKATNKKISEMGVTLMGLRADIEKQRITLSQSGIQ